MDQQQDQDEEWMNQNENNSQISNENMSSKKILPQQELNFTSAGQTKNSDPPQKSDIGFGKETQHKYSINVQNSSPAQNHKTGGDKQVKTDKNQVNMLFNDDYLYSDHNFSIDKLLHKKQGRFLVQSFFENKKNLKDNSTTKNISIPFSPNKDLGQQGESDQSARSSLSRSRKNNNNDKIIDYLSELVTDHNVQGAPLSPMERHNLSVAEEFHLFKNQIEMKEQVELKDNGSDPQNSQAKQLNVSNQYNHRAISYQQGPSEIKNKISSFIHPVEEISKSVQIPPKNSYFLNETKRKQISVIPSDNGFLEMRKKVSVMISRSGSQNNPINLTLSVNKQEQDQLREVLRLEKNLIRGALLQKTCARRLTGKSFSNQGERRQSPPRKTNNEEDVRDHFDEKYLKMNKNDKKSKVEAFHIQSLNDLDDSQVNRSFCEIHCDRSGRNYGELPIKKYVEPYQLRKYQQILLKKYDDEFIEQFEKGKEFQEYFPKNNISNVLQLINIRRKLNPFYRELLIRKRAQNKMRPQVRFSQKKLQKKSSHWRSFINPSIVDSISTPNSHL